MGIVHLATIALVGIVPGGVRSPISRGSAKSSLPSILREGELRKYYLVAFTLMSSFVGRYVAMGSRYAGGGGAVADRLFMLRAIGLLGMLPSPLAGYFGKLIGQKALLAASLSLAAAGLVLETLLPSSSLPAMAACTVFFVLGIAIAMPTLIGLIGGKAGAARGPAVSLFMFTLFFGASLAPVLATGVDFRLVDPALAVLLGVGLVIVLSTGRGEEVREPRPARARGRR
jgi:predicted MFS family arabinose efflux permease